MANKDMFSERERGMESEYFHKKEQELIQKMRRRGALEEDRKQMAEEIGVADEEVLEALQELGYSAATIKLLPILPLVQVAWAEGGVSDKERELILEIAKSRGIEGGGADYEQLIRWLDNQPSQEVYDNTLQALKYLTEAIPDDLREMSRQSLVEYCTQIAEVSGGILGFRKVSEEERQLIGRIANEIGQHREEAVRKVIGDR